MKRSMKESKFGTTVLKWLSSFSSENFSRLRNLHKLSVLPTCFLVAEGRHDVLRNWLASPMPQYWLTHRMTDNIIRCKILDGDVD